MRVLFVDKHGGLGDGYHTVEFTPVADDWLSWKTFNKELKIIHERCYHRLAMEHPGKLTHIDAQGVCALCGVEAPDGVQQFILLANAVRGYDAGKE